MPIKKTSILASSPKKAKEGCEKKRKKCQSDQGAALVQQHTDAGLHASTHPAAYVSNRTCLAPLLELVWLMVCPLAERAIECHDFARELQLMAMREVMHEVFTRPCRRGKMHEHKLRRRKRPTLTVLGVRSAASPAPSTFCLLFCPSASTLLPSEAGAAALLAAFWTAEARTGTRWVCLFSSKPFVEMSLFRCMASIGMRMMGFSILTCSDAAREMEHMNSC